MKGGTRMNVGRWLRPKVYIMGRGSLEFRTPYPNAVQLEEPGAPIPVCVHCGVVCDEGGYDLKSGYECVDCHVRVPLSWWGWHVAPRIDNAYYRYAMRFGKEVSR